MIIQALTKRYETLLANGKLDKPGWSREKVSFALSIDSEGNLKDLIDLRNEKTIGKKQVLEPVLMSVPTPVGKTSGYAASYMYDGIKYLLGIDKDGITKRSRESFETSRKHHLELLSDCQGSAAKAVYAFFNKWNPSMYMSIPHYAEYQSELSKNPSAVFWLEHEYAQDDLEVRESWDRVYQNNTNPVKMECLDTGKVEPIVRLHPNIKNVRGHGAQTMGAKLVSYNDEAFNSYGHTQGENAPTSEYAAFAYGVALNELLSDKNHAHALGDTTVVSWAEDSTEGYCDLFDAMLFRNNQNSTVSDTELTSLISKIVHGDEVNWGNIPINPENPFHILGLSPNAGRIAVRFYLTDSFRDISRKILNHYDRLKVKTPSTYMGVKYSLQSLLFETVNQKLSDKTASPELEGEMLRSILTDTQYPALLFNEVQLRIRAERVITPGRAAIIKAYLLKNPVSTMNDQYKEALTVELNEDCNYIPYLLGRAFSLMEGIQEIANPDINATIKDKYFTSASATPDIIFPILINLSQKHIKKIKGKNTGLAVVMERSLNGILARITSDYPKHLSLHDQGIFQLGYYHQREKRFEKKEALDNE